MYRVGVVGYGGWGSRLAADVASTSGAELAAIADPDAERRRVAGEEHDLPRGARFADAAAMYDGAPIDAVAIASPPAFHHEQVVAALDAGLCVLCEKPLVVTAAEARDVVDRAAEAPGVLMVDYQRHLDPAYRAVRDRYRDAAGGGDREPRAATGEFSQDWSGYLASGENWRTDPEVGGWGHLFSVGTHVLEATLWTTGLTPEYVSAEMAFHDADRRIDVRSSLAIGFAGGATGTMADCATASAHREHLRVWDDDGGVVLEGEDWGPPTLTVVDADGTRRSPELDRDGTPTTVEAFVEAMETGDPPATAEDALRVTALLEAAYESARTGERVAVELE